MRKAHAEKVYRDFREQLDDLAYLFEQVVDQFQVHRPESLTAELVLLAAVVPWDEFINKLLVALVNRNSTRFAKYLEARVRQDVTKRFGASTAEVVSVLLPKHPSKAQTAQLLEKNAYNSGFEPAELEERAQECPTPLVAQRFELKDDETACINAWRALRNFVAHRSGVPLGRVNIALSAPALDSHLRKPGTNQIRSAGSFLLAPPKRGESPRLDWYLGAMDYLARRFVGMAEPSSSQEGA